MMKMRKKVKNGERKVLMSDVKISVTNIKSVDKAGSLKAISEFFNTQNEGRLF